MKKIGGTGTLAFEFTEIAVRKMLHAAGFRFRLHVNDLPGKLDYDI